MDPITIVIATVVIALVAVVSMVVAIHQYRLNHSQHYAAELKETIQQAVSEAQEPLKDAVTTCVAQLDQQGTQLRENSEDLKRLRDTVTGMGVKVDMYWHSVLRRNGATPE